MPMLLSLAQRGLDEVDADMLGLSLLTPFETQALSDKFRAAPSIMIPYYCPRTGALLSDHIGCQPYYRVRFLDDDPTPHEDPEGTPKNFLGLTPSQAAAARQQALIAKETADAEHVKTPKKKTRQKYAQPAHTRPTAYFPRNLSDWLEVLDNPDVPLIITEGEFKAAATCKAGFPTIGLGGVDSFHSLKNGIEWLPVLCEVVWPRRNVYICYDSDYRANPNICRAINSLAEQLTRQGAYAFVVCLPDGPEGKKVGLDDFLLAHGESGPSVLEGLLASAAPIGVAQKLFELNETHRVILATGTVLNVATFQQTKASEWARTSCKKDQLVGRMATDGTIKYDFQARGQAWLEWGLRAEADCVVYNPGEEAIIIDGPLTKYNLWRGWGAEPKAGDVAPFLALLSRLFRLPDGTDDEVSKGWLLRWLGYPLKHPGVKLATAVMIWSKAQGIGKSLLATTMARIYGENAVSVTQTMMDSDFNEWQARKQFVYGDDMSPTNGRKNADYFKGAVTNEVLHINEKHVPGYSQVDRSNYMFTANSASALYLEDGDRRSFVHNASWVDPSPKAAEAFFAAYGRWLSGDGPSAVHHYLINLDFGDFTESSRAMLTEAKEAMTEACRSELQAWVHELKDFPDTALTLSSGVAIPSCDLMITQALVAAYTAEHSAHNTTMMGMSGVLTAAGFAQVLGGKRVFVSRDNQKRYWIIRNHDKWIDAPQEEVVKYLKGHFGTTEGKY